MRNALLYIAAAWLLLGVFSHHWGIGGSESGMIVGTGDGLE